MARGLTSLPLVEAVRQDDAASPVNQRHLGESTGDLRAGTPASRLVGVKSRVMGVRKLKERA